jgi:hypothetical protein
MTLALIIICLLVLLVIVDGTESSGHGSESGDAALPAEESDRSGPGRPCILAVTPISTRDPKEPRKHAWTQPRQVQTETTPR